MPSDDWSPPIPFATVDWESIPDTPGVYAVFEGKRLLYVGMAGRDRKGSLRKRLKNHRDGNMVNMLKQYLWFGIVQHLDKSPASKPNDAAKRCRDYMMEELSFAYRTCLDGAEARAVEADLKRGLSHWGAPDLNPARSDERRS